MNSKQVCLSKQCRKTVLRARCCKGESISLSVPVQNSKRVSRWGYLPTVPLKLGYLVDYMTDCLKIPKHLHARDSVAILISVSEDLNIVSKK